MICGLFEKQMGCRPEPAAFSRMLAREESTEPVDVVFSGPVALACAAGSLGPQGAARVEGEGEAVLAAWTGEIYNREELLGLLGIASLRAPQVSDCGLLMKLYRVFGRACAAKINGRFAFALYDRERDEVALGRDHLGIETLYYYEDPARFAFSSGVGLLVAHPQVPKQLNVNAVRRFLIFNYNPGWDTFFQGVNKVRPGTLLVLNRSGAGEQRYWCPSFKYAVERTVPEYCHDLNELMRDAVKLRLRREERLGIFLSGGMDSSSIAGISKELTDRPLRTFSYRCLGKSFDESGYARIMANYCQSDHREVIFSPEDVRRMETMVTAMNEPFCNAGITVATFLLGQAAQGEVSHVFSGDGGDEVFGGHPVYVADKVAALFEVVPAVVRIPLTAVLRRLPDSDQKLSLTVKLKRFCESLHHPRALGTQRWRVYYGQDELRKLLDQGSYESNGHGDDLFTDLVQLAAEADGLDRLSRSLYADLFSEVGFHLRRMDLLRYFGIAPRFPLLDYRLVEYVATIPSNLKIRGFSDTKWIQHRAMEGLLPDEIIHRKDKLGHSIPFKNWLRTEPVVKQFVQEVLAEQRSKRKGLINADYVQVLWNNHQERRQNNSHRIWSLAVLELWLAAHGL